MQVDQLKKYIPEEFVEKFKKEKIRILYPAQQEAIKKGIFRGNNLVVCAPTASGKTLIATLAIINHLNSSKKIIYIVPLIALAVEKYNYYKNFFVENIKVALSVGDMDSNDSWLRHYSLIITTCEKFDSLLRHGIDWLEEVGLVIIDEIHLLNDAHRGPALEITLSLLKKILPRAQFLGLSATIANVEEIAGWLTAEIVTSDFRSVKLDEGVFWDSRINFLNKKSILLDEELSAEEAIAKDTLIKRKKQLLIFVASRRIGESLAEKLSWISKHRLTEEEAKQLKVLSDEVLQTLSTPTPQCQKLANLICKGTAFHHAGLVAKQRNLIEDNFRKGLIKIICCTPTLALGVNLPAFRVLIRDIKRYYPGLGSVEIPVLEYKQFAGRAGRPQYDRFGEAVILARSFEEKQMLIQRYILGKPEKIISKLSQIKVLRMHTLALIASLRVFTLDDILDFLNFTFFGFQFKDLSFVKSTLINILQELNNWGFIQCQNGSFLPTSLGRRISTLYIDPQTAYFFMQTLNRIKLQGFSELGILQVVSYADELQPALTLRNKDLDLLIDTISNFKEEFLMDVPSAWEDNYEDFLKSLKAALCFLSWMDEKEEAAIFEEFQITPGELHNKLEIADWLFYSLLEIAKILNFQEIASYLKKIRIRLSYGVKEELLDLVNLHYIGRLRARKLFDKGIRDISCLRNTSFENVSQILGKKIALKVWEQLK